MEGTIHIHTHSTCSGKQKGNWHCRGCAFMCTWNRRKSQSDRTWSVDEPSAMWNEHQIPRYEIFEFQGTTAFINSLWLPDLTSLWINPDNWWICGRSTWSKCIFSIEFPSAINIYPAMIRKFLKRFENQGKIFGKNGFCFREEMFLAHY